MSEAGVWVLFSGFAAAVLAWPVQCFVRLRKSLILIICLVLFGLPWLARFDNTVVRVLVTLTCCAVLTPKVIDLASQPDCWRERGFRNWVLNLPNFTRLVADRGPGFRRHPHAMRWLIRGLIEVALGAALLAWWLRSDLRSHGFWLNHAFKVAAGYLLGFDGGFVLFCGLARVCGANVIDFSRNPVLAITPADFWRRYNREAGRFFRFRVYDPLVRSQRPAVAVLGVFVINGLGHEYLAWVLIGRIQGYQTAFFVLQGIATVLTYRVRPSGAIAQVARVLTIAFMFLTSALFFASVDQLLGW